MSTPSRTNNNLNSIDPASTFLTTKNLEQPSSTFSNPAPAAKKEYSPKLHIIAGGTGGLIGAVLTQPLDVLRTRYQASTKLASVTSTTDTKRNESVFKSLRNIWTKEGAFGLYRGAIPTFTLVFPLRAIYFYSYSQTKEYLSKHSTWSKNWIHFASAASAVVSVTTTMNPLFLLKTRIQLQEIDKTNPKQKIEHPHFYTGYVDCAKKVYKYEGIRGFYRGLTAAWLGISETGLYFVLYEQAKEKLELYKKENFPPSQQAIHAYEFLLMSSLCKTVASVLTYPHEVLKTRMRENAQGEKRYKNLIHAVRSINKHEGIPAFYSGLGVHLMRVIPTTAITFLVYEYIVQKFG